MLSSGKKSFLLPFILSVPFFLAYSDTSEPTRKTQCIADFAAQAVLIDGKTDDAAWADGSTSEIKINGVKAIIKICWDKENVYALVSFPSPVESRKHKPWRWNPSRQIYIPSGDREQELYLHWTENTVHSSGTDVWIWRSARTDGTGFADDYFLVASTIGPEQNSKIPAEYRQDSGKSSWFSRFFANFAGDEIPRFYRRNPSGSAADVKAKGAWHDGVWTVEFSRKLSTGNPDDIIFEPGKSYSLSISTEASQSIPVLDKLILEFQERKRQ